MRIIVGLLALASILLLTACGGLDGASRSGPPASSSDSADIDAGSVSGDGETDGAGAAAEPKVVTTTTLRLQADDLSATYEAVTTATTGLGGYIAEGYIRDYGGNPTATLKLRVPANRHDELLAVIRGQRGVTIEDEQRSAREVSAEYTDLQARLINLQRSEAQYRELLSRANTIPEITQVNKSIDDVRGQIERTQGRINLLNDQSAVATISLSLSAVPPPARAGIATPGEVLETAIDRSRTAALVLANGLVLALVATAWLVPGSIALIFAWRYLGRPLRAIYARLISW